MGGDRHALRRRLRSLPRGKAPPEQVESLAAAIAASQRRRAARVAAIPPLRYPEELPVAARRAEIMAAIRAHQVVLVCGETGSGKTTQLPKICLELGRGVDGLIGHTQPRRLAARAVATRVAEELGTTVGAKVGYKVRFTDQVGDASLVKLMTDGILLAELGHDRWLNQYDTLIIDEAHERSLNIDFLLGYLKQLLPKRPELKLIITSATLDAARIAAHFNAPVIEVSGRTYPVEIRYRPLLDPDAAREETPDLYQAIEAAIDELLAEGRGDILVFLPGEREIRDASHALRHRRQRMEILPLYARLSAADQQRIFHPRGGVRVILATNVAETSLTVPGIRYVIDAGLARLSRYSWRAKIQRLPIEKISRASANQRAGRCGRLSAGICVRLYDEQDFLNRPEFTDPEILRTHLAAVILQMAHLRLGDPALFPFIDPPDSRLISDGYRLLGELQAIDRQHQLTAIGHQLARLPIDPRLGRMLLGARETGALAEVLVIACALAVQDPRERPFEAQQAADAQHARFRDPHSDFIALLKLWEYLEMQAGALSNAALQRQCQKEFLSHRRFREWRDLHHQLRLALEDLGIRPGATDSSASAQPTPAEGRHRTRPHPPTPASPAEATGDDALAPERYAAIHRALLTGLLDQIGFREEKTQYLGCRGRRFYLFPGSGLRSRPPKWLMAAEITETTQVYARTAATIQPEWVEPLGAHLLKHHYGEPYWQRRQARVGGDEKLSLYGLVINPKHPVNFAAIDPPRAREVFIWHALIYGEWDRPPTVIERNRAAVEAVEDLEARTRRRDLLVDEQTLFDFYDQRLPPEINSGASFAHWFKHHPDPESLRLTEAALTRDDAPPITPDAFPSHWTQHGLRLPLSYRFEPGQDDDGVTLRIPLGILPQVDAARCEWLVPGLLEEKVQTLIKSLPKGLRKNFVPAPEFAKAVFQALSATRIGQREDQPLTDAIAIALKRMSGVDIPREAWGDDLPPYLRMNFAVVDRDKQVIASGRDLSALRARLAGAIEAQKPPARQRSFEKTGLIDWDFGPLPEFIEVEEDGYSIRRFPALTYEKGEIALKLFHTEADARRAMPRGLRALFRQRLKQEVRYLDKNLPEITQHCLRFVSVAPCQVLKDDLVETAIQRVFLDNLPPPRDAQTFNQRLETGRNALVSAANDVSEILGAALPIFMDIQKRLKENLPLSWIEAAADIRTQLDALIHPGFLIATPAAWLPELPRYLNGIEKRLTRLSHAPDKDRRIRVDIEPLTRRLQDIPPEALADHSALTHYRWLLEELRVSLFAQELGTKEKVSVQRLERYWQETLAAPPANAT